MPADHRDPHHPPLQGQEVVPILEENDPLFRDLLGYRLVAHGVDRALVRRIIHHTNGEKRPQDPMRHLVETLPVRWLAARRRRQRTGKIDGRVKLRS
jgi:hypothetical protein